MILLPLKTSYECSMKIRTGILSRHQKAQRVLSPTQPPCPIPGRPAPPLLEQGAVQLLVLEVGFLSPHPPPPPHHTHTHTHTHTRVQIVNHSHADAGGQLVGALTATEKEQGVLPSSHVTSSHKSGCACQLPGVAGL